MVHCKKCHSNIVIKNGFVRGSQRYKCRGCGLNFIKGDRRQKHETAIKKALCVLFYCLGKASFSMLGKILNHSPSIIYRWIVEAIDKTEEPHISSDVQEIEFDEVWHFLQKKVKNYGSSRRWIVAQGELLPGLQGVVMLQRSENYTPKSSI